jgi:hypothetical protein
MRAILDIIFLSAEKKNENKKKKKIEKNPCSEKIGYTIPRALRSKSL